jgi:3-hydroxyacyl-CoA dehydrogenase
MRGDVLLLWLDAPPANLLTPGLRAALLAALDMGLANDAVRAIVLIGGGQGFSGGADVTELGRAVMEPSMAQIVQTLLDAPKPVIAALHGLTLGAAGELALAAQARIASPDLRFGLRDALAGHLPSAGATQTLPKLIGAAQTLRLIGQGAMVNAAEAVALGLVDHVTSTDLAAAAVVLARDPPAAGRTPGLRDGRGYQAALAAARTTATDTLTRRLIDCVEAAQLLPLAQGVEFEAEAASEVAEHPDAAALRYAMIADLRMASELSSGRALNRIGIWGAAAAPLIWPALHAGLDVVFADDDRAALVGAVEKVALGQEAQIAAGRLTAAARDAEWARLTPAAGADAFADIGLVIAAKPGVTGPVLQLGGDGDGPALMLGAPGVGELQFAPADRAFGATAAATLRGMGMRLAITQSPPRAGIVRSLLRAARMAIDALVANGVHGDSLTAGLQGVLRQPLPAATGPLTMSVLDVQHRVFGAMAAEGARLVAAGAVPRASDIDALAIAALGVPRAMGGPLFAADQRGLLVFRRDLVAWATEHPVWAPPPLLDRLVSEGKRLSEVVR